MAGPPDPGALSPRDLALRAQDVEAGVSSLAGVPPDVQAEIAVTCLAGKAARLAAHIGGADVFESEADLKKLLFVASSLGIDPAELPYTLRILETAGMATVVATGIRLKKVTESIPKYSDLYTRLGQVLVEEGLSEVEAALLHTYHTVTKAPVVGYGDLPVFGLDQRIRVPLLEVASQASLLRTIDRDDQDPLTFSPQYWDENPDTTLHLIEKYSTQDLAAVTNLVEGHPGLAIEGLSNEGQRSITVELAHSGILPTPTVHGKRGDRSFAFQPYANMTEDPILASKLMEKVRALIACVRYGQHYGMASRINDPLALLHALRVRKRLGAHSDAFSQYRLLIERGIVQVFRVGTSDRYETHLIETEENLRALDTAITWLQHGRPFDVADVNTSLQQYIVDASYDEPVIARAKRRYTHSAISARLTQQIVEDALTQL